MTKLKVAFLFDESNNWLSKFFDEYIITKNGCDVHQFVYAEKISDFDIVFILGYTKILPSDFLSRNGLNLVVHESDLPNGKGFAPIQWQLIEGKSEIKISLIEAVEEVDSGDIFLQHTINFVGSELYEEIRHKQAIATIGIIDDFIDKYPNVNRVKQIGEGSFYPKRKTKDGELDIEKTIKENFNLLRVGNNEGWPSFFFYRGKKYIIKIYKDE